MLAPALPAPTREHRLWSEEVAHVLATAPSLEPVVGQAVRVTLHALAADPSTDEATRADVVAMLHATAARASAVYQARSEGPVFRGSVGSDVLFGVFTDGAWSCAP